VGKNFFHPNQPQAKPAHQTSIDRKDSTLLSSALVLGQLVPLFLPRIPVALFFRRTDKKLQAQPRGIDRAGASVNEEVVDEASDHGADERGHKRDPEVVRCVSPKSRAGFVAKAVSHPYETPIAL